ncbi:hypothetical protein OO013_04315 [Mangrovivirga sp. M17]|uniref:Lipoprotein n=1 Tax=Mangrovivirga halotolerans TaxID=2993936 RepID=A0ABT3RMU1_9BACT|nr:hypothetical protein [Mangrovivirga halotolerans]MCX2743074.1 hypothetical protein [Mangrovivirga halotolerans]
MKISDFPHSLFSIFILSILLFSCEDNDDSELQSLPVFLVIDEESISEGLPLNDFSASEINGDIADIGFRQELKFFDENPDMQIDLLTGQVGDEGWFALTVIPEVWRFTGPMANGLENYVLAGPGLGSPKPTTDREVYLEEVPGVIPLRATGLKMLEGQLVFGIVLDSDVNINYSPLEGNIKGENLGIVAFIVENVKSSQNSGGSSLLPVVTVKIVDAEQYINEEMFLFSNVPVPASSSEPMDVIVPDETPQIQLEIAD